MIPRAYVKTYVKRQKYDAADAGAIYEAASRPTINLVAVKTAGQQTRGMLFRNCDLLVNSRSPLDTGSLYSSGMIRPQN